MRLEGKTWGEIAQALKCDPKTLWDLRQRYDLDSVVAQMVEDQMAQLGTGFSALLAKAAPISAQSSAVFTGRSCPAASRMGETVTSIAP